MAPDEKEAPTSINNHPDAPSNLASYADLFERLIDPVLLIDPESGQILDANTTAERVFDFERQDTASHPDLYDGMRDDEKERFAQALRIARRRYYPRQIRLWMTAAGHVRVYFEASICALDLKNSTTVVQLILRDKTREYEAEQAAKRYLEEVQGMNRKLEELSITDEMTRVSNFRRFKHLLALEHERSERMGSSYAVIFCDIDHFKHYNDHNGHPAGDDLLRIFASTLKESCRGLDTVARYGGEEFVILCPGTDEAGAKALAERLRATIQKIEFAAVANQPLGFLSMSVGVAAFPENARTQDEVLKKADLGVYHSKEHGRNRVTGFSELANDPDALAKVMKKAA